MSKEDLGVKGASLNKLRETMGCRQAVKTQGFDSCMRWFDSNHLSQPVSGSMLIHSYWRALSR